MENKKGKNPLVGIVMGSDSDLPVMEEAEKILNQFQVPYEVTLSSAHRSPDRTHRYAISAEERGLRVIIVGAGAAAHLAGVIASETILPVIGVPIDSSPLKGMDSLLANAGRNPRCYHGHRQGGGKKCRHIGRSDIGPEISQFERGPRGIQKAIGTRGGGEGKAN